VTVAVNVTVWPSRDGFEEEATVVVVAVNAIAPGVVSTKVVPKINRRVRRSARFIALSSWN
jgi:hypothetical protein